jgi:hypothetical protein
MQTGIWINPTSGVGAGIDSFFEYLLKVSETMSDILSTHALGLYFIRGQQFSGDVRIIVLQLEAPPATELSSISERGHEHGPDRQPMGR